MKERFNPIAIQAVNILGYVSLALAWVAIFNRTWKLSNGMDLSLIFSLLALALFAAVSIMRRKNQERGS